MENKRNYIVMKVPLFDMAFDEQVNLFNTIKEQLPSGYGIICIPRDVDWCEMTLPELREMHQMMGTYIKELENDIDTKTREGS